MWYTLNLDNVGCQLTKLGEIIKWLILCYVNFLLIEKKSLVSVQRKKLVSLSKYFSAGSGFVPQETVGNVWRHSLFFVFCSFFGHAMVRSISILLPRMNLGHGSENPES